MLAYLCAVANECICNQWERKGMNRGVHCSVECNMENSAPTGRIFVKFDIGVFCENLSRKFKFY
jgi:hypothetical protein